MARIGKLLLCIVVATCITFAGKAMASMSAYDVVLKVFNELSGETYLKKLFSVFTEHDRVYPVYDGRTFIIPAGDYGGTRISCNFNHRSWVPRGSGPVRVRFTVHGVDDKLRRLIRVQMKADKQARKDRNRGPGWLHDGMVFYLKYGTGGDRAYYFVERGQVKGGHLPQGAYLQLDLLD